MAIETKRGAVRSRSCIELAGMILGGVLAAGCTPDPAGDEVAAPAEEHPSARVVSNPGARQATSPEVRATYISAVQAGAPGTYRIERSGAVWRAPNPAQRFATKFSAAGVQLEPRGGRATWSLSLHTDRYGCEGDLRPVAPAEPTASGNRVDYRHAGAAADSGLVEWYVNGPLGLEQGFTLEAAPPCRAPSSAVVGIDLALAGGLTAALDGEGAIALLDASGTVVARYTDLHVSDSTGRVLPSRFGVERQRISLRVEAAGVVYPMTLDPLVAIPQGKLVASDGVAGDDFGTSVAVSGNTAVVGADAKDSKKGAAYVFAYDGSSWTQQGSKLVASDGVAGDFFGYSVAVSGTTAVVGASGKDSFKGAAYAFVFRSSDGDPCGDSGSCASGFCVDGVCCHTICTGTCEVCAASLGASADGTCTTAPAGYLGGKPSCSGYVCDGMSASCPTSCISDDGCASTHYCAKDGNCKTRRMNGSACDEAAGGDCLNAGCRVCNSNSCVDGVCGIGGGGTGGGGTGAGTGGSGGSGGAPGTNQSFYSCSFGSPAGNPPAGLLAALTGLALAVAARRRRLSRSLVDVEHR